MDAHGFLAALTPAVTDVNARERFLALPKAVNQQTKIHTLTVRVKNLSEKVCLYQHVAW
jgi:hypothetical protein